MYGFLKRLNLPAFGCRVRRKGSGYVIYDFLRRRYVALTPEEWVRQHLVHYLVEVLGYPRGLMGVEVVCAYGRLVKRVDVVVYGRGGVPWMVVECKGADGLLTAGVAYQVACYNAVLRAPVVLISNGVVHYSYALDAVRGCYVVLGGIPRYAGG